MKLSVSKRNQQIQSIDLGKEVFAHDYSETIFLIGRSKECHIILDDKQVSREHIRIIHKNGKWFAEKVNQDNSGLHNGEDFNRVELEQGDTLTVAGFTVTVEGESDHIAPVKIVEEVVVAAPPPVVAKKEAPAPAQQPEPEPIVVEKDQNATREIDVSELTKEISTDGLNDSPVSGEATADIEIPSDFQSFDDEPKADSDSEFISDDVSEVEAELALGLNADGDAPLEDSGEDNMSYSLENIDSGGEDESTKVIQSFAKIQLELFGETAPYDRYLIEKEKTFIGRDPSKCQIVLNDTEVSSVHAVITKNNILVTLEDLKSSNGTLLNGERINKATLNHNDEFVIGGVTFTVKFRSDFIKEESQTLMAVDENQTVEVEEVVEVQAEEGEQFDALGGIVSNEPEEKSIIKRIMKDEKKRKTAIYAIVALVAAYVFLGDDTPPPAQTATKKTKKAPEKKAEKPLVNKTTGKKLTEDERRSLSALYEIGKNHYYDGRYREALDEFQKITAVDPNFNSNLSSLVALSKEGLSKIEEQEKKRKAEQEAAEKKIKVKELTEKAAEYVKDRRVELAQDVFNEIAKLDPENIAVTKMKMELDDWAREKAKKELEEVTKKKAREDKVEKLKPGKTLYLQKEWFKAISKLEEFLKVKDMDEDLTKEATDMLKISRDEISSATAPLLGKAKSLMEGQDLKGAYEVYQQVLKVEPSNTEALTQTGEIKEQLTNKARKIYREAIISESLSLFQDAKEKFQEVQQISPVDSDYYKKASEKLRDYLE